MDEPRPASTFEVVGLPLPAAGGGFTYTVPGTAAQRILAVSFSLVNFAAAANRSPVVTFQDGDGVIFAAAGSPFVTTSGVTARFTFAAGTMQFGADDAAQIGGPLPAVYLLSGMRLVVTITNVNAGDRVQLPRVFVEQFPVRA